MVSKFRHRVTELLLKEMAYPSNFSLEEFSMLPTYAKRIQYCKERLKSLGQGSARWVFQIDDEKVLKIAKNKKGLAQNARESSHITDDFKPLFAEVFEKDDDNLWLEMELARPAKEADIKKFLGMTSSELIQTVLYIRDKMKSGEHGTSTPGLHNKISNIIHGDAAEWNPLRELYYYCITYRVTNVGDYAKKNSWGVVRRDNEEYLVIIDNGFDDEIWNNYYKK